MISCAIMKRKSNNRQIKEISNVTYTMDKTLNEQLKQVAQKEGRKYSNIIELLVRRYVHSKL